MTNESDLPWIVAPTLHLFLLIRVTEIMRRNRPRHSEEAENHDRWLVSYADFITLLFAFFVVMYAISSVNEGKYRVLSDALEAAFRQSARTTEPLRHGDLARSPDRRSRSPFDEAVAIDLPFPTRPKQWEPGTDPARASDAPGKPQPPQGFADPDLEQIARQVAAAVAGVADQDQIHIRRDERWLEIEIGAQVLFRDGHSMLAANAYPLVEKIAAILKPYRSAIRVEGFTDDTPLFSPPFRSNWDLSAARAASVVHLLKDNGVDPARMAAIGYGSHHPVASNLTPDGRARNRRVVLVVLPGQDPRWERSPRQVKTLLDEQDSASIKKTGTPGDTQGAGHGEHRATAASE